MYRKDFLEQQIEQLGRVLSRMLAQMLGIKHATPADLEPASRTLKEELNWNLEELLAISESEWIDTLMATGKFNADNLERLADLFAVLAKTDAKNARAYLQKSLLIYRHVDAAERTFSLERQTRIDAITKKLTGC